MRQHSWFKITLLNCLLFVVSLVWWPHWQVLLVHSLVHSDRVYRDEWKVSEPELFFSQVSGRCRKEFCSGKVWCCFLSFGILWTGLMVSVKRDLDKRTFNVQHKTDVRKPELVGSSWHHRALCKHAFSLPCCYGVLVQTMVTLVKVSSCLQMNQSPHLCTATGEPVNVW